MDFGGLDRNIDRKLWGVLGGLMRVILNKLLRVFEGFKDKITGGSWRLYCKILMQVYGHKSFIIAYLFFVSYNTSIPRNMVRKA